MAINQKLKAKKLAKAKARRKDFVKRKNINSNVPTEKTKVKKEIYKSDFDHRIGKPKLSHVGYKEVTIKTKVFAIHKKGSKDIPRAINASRQNFRRKEGMIAYPANKLQKTK